MSKADIDDFYSEDSIADLQTVLGSGMSWFSGLFRPCLSDVSDGVMDDATDRVVRLRYPHVQKECTVPDTGCDWHRNEASLGNVGLNIVRQTRHIGHARPGSW